MNTRLRMHHAQPTKPVIGISCCTKLFGQFGMPNHGASDTYVRATDQVVGAVPVLLPANGRRADIPTLLSRLDGLILTGSRSNVQPALYGGPPHPDGVPEDAMRDLVTLPLIRAAIAQGLPVLAICRGLQELNVALGGTLHQRLQDLPGRIDHSAPFHPSARVRTGKAHAVAVAPGSWLRSVAGADTIAVNSLHNQGIDRLAPGLVAEGVAPDGTVEAVRVFPTRDFPVPGFAVGVQWHPEYDFETDAVSRSIFEAFAAALHERSGAAMMQAAD
jgi:putative glutamine amidotransferase